MSEDAISDLVRQLIRVRGFLAADVPGSPAWAATVEWRDEPEVQIRSMNMDPDALARSAKLALRSGRRRAPSSAPWTDPYPADAR
jgi:hypothetical protein